MAASALVALGLALMAVLPATVAAHGNDPVGAGAAPEAWPITDTVNLCAWPHTGLPFCHCVYLGILDDFVCVPIP